MYYEVTFAVGNKNHSWSEKKVTLAFHDQKDDQTYSEWQKELEEKATDLLMKEVDGESLTFVTLLNYAWINNEDVL